MLTSETAMRVITAVLRNIARPFHVVLDCAELTALDSAGLGAIVQVYKKVRELGGNLYIASVPDGYARNIFAITRLDTVLDLFDDVESAVAAHAAAD